MNICLSRHPRSRAIPFAALFSLFRAIDLKPEGGYILSEGARTNKSGRHVIPGFSDLDFRIPFTQSQHHYILHHVCLQIHTSQSGVRWHALHRGSINSLFVSPMVNCPNAINTPKQDTKWIQFYILLLTKTKLPNGLQQGSLNAFVQSRINHKTDLQGIVC